MCGRSERPLIVPTQPVQRLDDDRSHVEASNRPRGNASRDAPRSSSGRDAERPGLHSHAERGNDH
ncbi:hypothetical protein EIY71_00080 [Pseudomonas sp. CH235]|nr:hypothetical protein EIY71_00080 [Pseudomonas sp. CH235]